MGLPRPPRRTFDSYFWSQHAGDEMAGRWDESDMQLLFWESDMRLLFLVSRFTVQISIFSCVLNCQTCMCTLATRWSTFFPCLLGELQKHVVDNPGQFRNLSSLTCAWMLGKNYVVCTL